MPLSTIAGALFQLASATTSGGDVYHGRNGATDVRMPAASTAEVQIDGRLDEPVWQTAPLLTGFSLYQPADNRPAPDSTDVRIWYSRSALYIGIRAFEAHGPVRATLADRDRVASDDHVEIHLDPFEERRRAFVFIVNALGVQADGTKSEGGGFIPGANVAPGQNDLSPDFQWQSSGHVTEWGYEVELRIPFSSLRFPARDVQRWGIQFNRRVQHSGYEQTWTPAVRASASFISQEGWLTGMRGLQHGADVSINPELTTTVSGAPTATVNGAPGRGWHYESNPRIGGNVRAGLGSNFVLNGTVRPDFSQVEADALQVAADQRFALFYPERRPFFVEGSDQFNVPNTLVYTRRVVQPDAALKLTGRLGRSNVSLLSALDVAPPSIVRAEFRDKPFVNIVRLTRDFAQQSQSGFVYSERARRGASNRLTGVDVRHVFGMYYASLQAAGSVSTNAGVTRSGALWEAVVDRTGRAFGFHYGLLGIQPDFRADNGFVARTGYVQPSFANRYTIYGTPGALFERYNVFIQTSGLWRYADIFRGRSVLESRASATNQFTLRGGWSVSLNPALATYAFDPSAYANLRQEAASAPSPLAFIPSPRVTTGVYTAIVNTPQFRRFAASVGGTRANDVDFLETSRIDRTAFTANLDLRPTGRLRMNATYSSSLFERQADGFSSFSTRIPRVKVEYQVRRPIFVRVVSQYEATRREALRDWETGRVLLERRGDGTFAPSVRRQSNLLRTDWLFSYRPRPGAVFFVGYGGSMTEPDALAFDGLRRTSDGFFVKASWIKRWVRAQ
ncbi:MAG: DUF5916 domain-containing protein [Gemmatimonas sp.]